MDPVSVGSVDETVAARDAWLPEISMAIDDHYRRQFGRTATSVTTEWCGADAVTCFLEGSLTTTERRRIAAGQDRAVCDERSALHHDGAAGFCASVEGITGRTVRSFHSSLDMGADGLANETFLFWPVGLEGASRCGEPPADVDHGTAQAALDLVSAVVAAGSLLPVVEVLARHARGRDIAREALETLAELDGAQLAGVTLDALAGPS